MNISLETIIDEHPNIILQVSAKDLKDFAYSLIEEAKEVAKMEYEAAQNHDRLLTVKEATEMLSVTTSTLWRWDKMGYLKKVWIGGKRRYRKSDIERVIETRL